jgi:hypothetical protein
LDEDSGTVEQIPVGQFYIDMFVVARWTEEGGREEGREKR